MEIQLIAEIRDPELLAKSLDSRGTMFYKKDKQGNITKIAYFSTSRIILYNGDVDENLAALVRVEGYEADVLEVDRLRGTLRIIQKKPSAK
ncbi:hypothetical protein MUP01_04870 [Candidatus Bathyarchaeota archaeon]|nr:hypothetical protein [Candidatus Bathyarchaeota archaeon]